MNLTAGERKTSFAHRPGKSQFTLLRLRAFLFPSLPARALGGLCIHIRYILRAESPFRSTWALPSLASCCRTPYRRSRCRRLHVLHSHHDIITSPRCHACPAVSALSNAMVTVTAPPPPCCMQARYIDADPSQVNFNILALGPNIC